MNDLEKFADSIRDNKLQEVANGIGLGWWLLIAAVILVLFFARPVYENMKLKIDWEDAE